jgi:hypothetical protein
MQHGRRGTRIAGAGRLLNGVSDLLIPLTNVTNVVLQAALVTAHAAAADHHLWWRTEYAADDVQAALLPATTIATADGMLRHGEVAVIDDLDPSKLCYLYLYLTTDAGVLQAGGLLDYALIIRDMG